MAPESCGDRVLVVSSPYKSHTLSVATIQLGQHHLKSYAVTFGPSDRVTKSDVGRNSTPPLLSSFVLQPCSFDSRCAGRVSRSVSISTIAPHTHFVRLWGLCFGEPHAQTVDDLFPSSVVAVQTTTLGYNFSLHQKRYSPTRGDIGVSKRRRSDNEGSQSKMWAVPCYAVRCHEHKNTSIKMCVCVLVVMVFRWYCLLARKKKTCLQPGLCLAEHFWFEL